MNAGGVYDKSLPNFYYEKKLRKEGFSVIAGLDEVGRGCFAGPVVAACVVFKELLSIHRCIDSNIVINDSKRLTPKRREIADEWIRENALTWGLGEASVSEINRLGIVRAVYSAFRRAVASANERLDGRINFLLIDAFYVPYIAGLPSIRKVKKNGRIKKYSRKNTRQLALIRGDCKCVSIAAASIIAKVYRDKLMEKIGSERIFEKYCWYKNKGYGTRDHRKALLKYGITKHHRIQFVEKYLKGNDR